MQENRIPKIFVIIISLFSVFVVQTALAEQLVRYEKTITLEAAIEIAQIALKASRANGATNVAIAVVDSAARPPCRTS